jgi:hypothetical protein
MACTATAAKPHKVTKTAHAASVPDASTMGMAQPLPQALQRAGEADQESHLRINVTDWAPHDGQGYKVPANAIGDVNVQAERHAEAGAPHFAVGITNSAPFAIVSGHLCITLFCLV